MNVVDERTPVMLTWDDVARTVDALAGRILADRMPEVLVGVLRGGLVPAVLLGHKVGVRSVRAVEVTHTIDDSVGADKFRAPRVVNAASIGDLTGMDVLLIDDIAGSGDTLECTIDLLQAAGATRVRTAVLTVNHANWRRSQSPADVVTYIGDVVDRWVIFPWEGTT